MPLKPHQEPRKSPRIQGYDYSQNGAYFITLCTQNRICIFGEIQQEEMRLNDAGNMILKWWNELPNKFPNIELDSCILMPNHLHTIVILFDEALGAHVGAPLQIHNSENEYGSRDNTTPH
jgi:hypothetical protein